MIKSKEELANYKAFSFINPNLFETPFDKTDAENMSAKEFAEAQYKKGLEIGQESGKISITVNGTWTAGGSESFEVIGRNRNTKELLQGMLDSGAEITVHRIENGNILEPRVVKNSAESIQSSIDHQELWANSIKDTYPNATVIKLQDLGVYALSGQVAGITNNQLKMYDFESIDDDHMILYNKDSDMYLVRSNNDYLTMQRDKIIKSQIEGVEPNANVIEKKSLLDISLGKIESLDEVPQIKQNDKTFYVFPQGKAYHQDQQRVFYIAKDNVSESDLSEKKRYNPGFRS